MVVTDAQALTQAKERIKEEAGAKKASNDDSLMREEINVAKEASIEALNVGIAAIMAKYGK